MRVIAVGFGPERRTRAGEFVHGDGSPVPAGLELFVSDDPVVGTMYEVSAGDDVWTEVLTSPET